MSDMSGAGRNKAAARASDCLRWPQQQDHRGDISRAPKPLAQKLPTVLARVLFLRRCRRCGRGFFIILIAHVQDLSAIRRLAKQPHRLGASAKNDARVLATGTYPFGLAEMRRNSVPLSLRPAIAG